MVSAGVPRVASAWCPTPLVFAGVVCVSRPWLVVVTLHYSIPLLSSTLLFLFTELLLLWPVRDW
ncbi:hypothetical protein Taro_007566 [Colocasia esculenta]|uniref:Uncharacterized protein n=1 Tax=Colocasia esculenta TaxID=4460 RepID=A0A843TYI8_COLES|nr:hypothetical protein [Colocasia esculenta]